MFFISIFSMLAVFLLAGFAAQKVLKYSFSVTGAMMIGFLFLFSVFHVIAYAFLRLSLPFTQLFWLYTFVLLAIVVISVCSLSGQESRFLLKNHIITLCGEIRHHLPTVLLTLGIAFGVLLLTLLVDYSSTDDSYYLPRAMEIIRQNNVGISHGFAWTGLSETSYPVSADASTLEIWKSYWSFLFHTNVTIFCRNAFTVVLYVVSLCSYYQAYRSFSKQKDDLVSGCIFLIVYLLFLLPDSHTSYWLPFWAIRYPSQGKSILLNIIMPDMLCCCAKIVACRHERIPASRWFLLSLVLTAGIASSIIGVFWTVLFCVSLGLPYLIFSRGKDFPKLLPQLLLTLLPVMIYAGLTLLVVSDGTDYLDIPLDRWSAYVEEGMNIRLLIPFALCLVYVVLKGTYCAKWVLLGGSVTLALGLLNPLFFGFVAKYLTTGSTYTRLFWMVPTYFTIAYVLAEIIPTQSAICRRALICVDALCAVAVIAACIVKGPTVTTVNAVFQRTHILQPTDLPRMNSHCLPTYITDIGEAVCRDKGPGVRVRVMWLIPYDCLLRQYSEQIELPGATRENQKYYADQPLGICDISPLDIFRAFDLKGRCDFEDPLWAHEKLVQSQVEYIVVYKESGFYQRETVPEGFEAVLDSDGVKLYRVLS